MATISRRAIAVRNVPTVGAESRTPEKPTYSVPSIADIRKIPWNGLNVVSTFAGAGGSSTGYRIAGFRILLASEFVEAARETYKANAAPYTLIDGRDIREVEPADVLSATKLKVGELDVLDGSPPCASFSTAGRRQEGWGAERSYSDRTQRSDDLFFEFVRLVAGIKPKVFVAENVSGLIKGTAKGYFLEILQAFKAAGYRVEARLLDAQWLGVPQARQRLIFVGVRDDLGLTPAFPAPLPYRYSVRDVIPWISKVECANGFNNHAYVDASLPAATIQASRPVHVEAGTDISRFAIGNEWAKLKEGEQSERFFSLVRVSRDKPCPTITASGGSSSIACVVHPTERRKFSIAELKRICGFPDDFVLTGTYGQKWERLGRAVPPVMMAKIAATVRDDILGRLS